MEKEYSGLILHGEVTNRHIKKNVGESNKEYITYTIKDKDGKEHFVKEWNPDKDNCYRKGDNVSINVYVKTYLSNGSAKYGLCVDKGTNDFLGEEF